MNPKYIVFDGLDGSGKGLQMKLVKKRMKHLGFGKQVVFTREPGGTPFAEKIRKIILDSLAKGSTPFNNMLLFFAAREELMYHLVFPALLGGKSVISDRGDSSTFAFQIYGEGRREMRRYFEYLRSEVFYSSALRCGGPDLYVFFDLPPEVAYQRMANDTSRVKTHFDLRPVEYHERVREGFRDFANVYKKSKNVIVDANRSPELVHEETWKVVSEQLGLQ